jgi:hypothetical protein
MAVVLCTASAHAVMDIALSSPIFSAPLDWLDKV